jgi:hypothetical protein
MKQFVESDRMVTAQTTCPWARFIIRVEGGYQCFEFINDYLTWKNQI